MDSEWPLRNSDQCDVLMPAALNDSCKIVADLIRAAIAVDFLDQKTAVTKYINKLTNLLNFFFRFYWPIDYSEILIINCSPKLQQFIVVLDTKDNAVFVFTNRIKDNEPRFTFNLFVSKIRLSAAPLAEYQDDFFLVIFHFWGFALDGHLVRGDISHSISPRWQRTRYAWRFFGTYLEVFVFSLSFSTFKFQVLSHSLVSYINIDVKHHAAKSNRALKLIYVRQ